MTPSNIKVAAISVATTLVALFVLKNLGMVLLLGFIAGWFYIGHKMYKAGDGAIPPGLGHAAWPLAFFINGPATLERFFKSFSFVSSVVERAKGFNYEFRSPVVITKKDENPVVTMSPSKAKKNSAK